MKQTSLKKRWRRYFTNGIPEYLARHYWWAYLWKTGVWFFDHHFMINAILFGQYNKLVNTTIWQLEQAPIGEMVQISCVYGGLTPALVQQLPHHQFHLVDVAPIQLALTKRKLLDHAPLSQQHVTLAIMNAESLAYTDNSFDTVLIFFLLHELPATARDHVLTEALRVLRPGGRLLICEYGEFTPSHFLHQWPPLRFLLGILEPFLPDFWHNNLKASVEESAANVNKCVISSDTASNNIVSRSIATKNATLVFNGFYRVVEYQISSATSRLNNANAG